MSEELKAWAVVNEDGVLVEVHADERDAIVDASDRSSVGFPNEWVVKELVEKEPEQKFVMDEDQYKELMKLNKIYPRFNVYGALSTVLEDVGYLKLRKIVKTASNISQARFALLWTQLEETDPDELIEIVPTMKWFVRSKEQYQPDMDFGISERGYLYLTPAIIYSIEYYEMNESKVVAKQFDTKEEAELWTNPLTEAVQLSVEGD